jgi:flagellar biosynthesis chaperone FliJ
MASLDKWGNLVTDSGGFIGLPRIQGESDAAYVARGEAFHQSKTGGNASTPLNNNSINTSGNTLSGGVSNSIGSSKPNLYYTSGDAQAAQQLGSYYNLVPYTSGMTIGPNDYVIGGTAAIPNSALINPNSRIAAGYDAAETAQQVNNYIKNLNTTSAQSTIPSILQTPQFDFDAFINQLTNNIQQQISSIQSQLSQPVQKPINIAEMYKKGTTLNQLNPYANYQYRSGGDGARVSPKQAAVSRYLANDIWKDKIKGGANG